MATTQTIPTALANWYKPANNATVPKSAGMLTQAGSTQAIPATYNPTTLKTPTNWNVTRDQTVAGNIEDITRKDSPLMQLAQTRAAQKANRTGLLNSSMAVGAAQDAVLSAATPIAQADADVRSKAAGYNAETANTFAKTNAAMENESKNFGAQAINRANEFNAANEFNRRQQEDAQAFDKETRLGTQNFNKSERLGTQAFNTSERLGTQAYDKQQALFEANVKASLAQIDHEANWDIQSQNIYGGLGQEFTRAMQAINTNTNMDQQSKDYAIRQMFDAYKAQISMLSAVGSIPDVSKLLVVKEPVYKPAPTAPATTKPTTAPTYKDAFAGKAYFLNGKYYWK